MKVIGVRGFEVDVYYFQTLPEVMCPTEALATAPVEMTETAGTYVIKTQGGTFSVDRRNGMFTLVKDGKPVLVKAPELMVLLLNAEGEDIQVIGKDQKFAPYTPVCAHWIATGLLAVKEENGVRVQVKGVYDEAGGGFAYFFKNTGEVIVSYHFTMRKDVSPRQVGLVFSLPEAFDKIQWKRKGYWSVYPADHLGALEGEAVAYDPSLPVLGLAV